MKTASLFCTEHSSVVSSILGTENVMCRMIICCDVEADKPQGFYPNVTRLHSAYDMNFPASWKDIDEFERNNCDVYVGGKVRVSEFMIFLDLQHCGSK